MPLALKEIHPVSHATERQLVRAVREGDDRAFEQLFSRYRRRITAYVYGLVNDHGRAEDLTQEVFISALRRLRETQGPISFKPWIYEIARNACIDEFRRVSRTSVVSLDAEAEADGPAPIVLADHATPEVRLERKQQIGDLFGAFSSLPDNQHRVLVLRELEGLSYGEIGSQMGMSRPMVESTLFRARRRLSQEYDELASGRRCLDVQAAVDSQEVRGLATLGIRERRRIARHLHHCSDCLRYARMAGVDESVLRVPGPARRVAALLPFGWLRLAWHRARGKGSTQRTAGAAHRMSALAPAAPQAAAAGKLAAAAAALLLTGGGAVAIVQAHGSPAHRSPAPGVPAAGHDVSLRSAPVRTTLGASSVNRNALGAATAGAASAVASVASGQPRRAPVTTAGGLRGGAVTPSGRPVAPATSTRVRSGSPGSPGRRAPVQSPLGTIVSRTTGTVGHVVSTLPGTLGGVVSKVPTTVGGVVSKVPATVGGVVSKVPATVGGVVSKVPATVGGVVSKVPATVGGVVSKGPSTVGGLLPKAPSPVSKAPGTLGGVVAPVTGGGLGSVVGTAPKGPGLAVPAPTGHGLGLGKLGRLTHRP